MVNPTFKIEIDGNDVTNYVIGNGNIDTLTSDQIGSGSFYLSTQVPYTIEDFQEIKFYLKVTSYVHLFTGLITKVKEEGENFRYKIEVTNTSFRYQKKTATNKFRQDSSTGNSIYIMQAINDEYVPEISYNGTTMPASTYEFTEQAYQNKFINEVYDFISEMIGRDWWVDKDKLLHCEEREFTAVTTTIAKENVKNAFDIDKDISKMANIVVVDGARITTNITEIIAGTGTVMEYDLTYVPNSGTKVGVGTTVNYSVAIEGAEGFDTDYDCYFKPNTKKLKFNSIILGTGTSVIVTYDVVSMIHEEIQDGASISDNISMEKIINNENVTTQYDAFILADNYRENYSYPLQLISGELHLTEQAQITDWQIGKKVPINYTDPRGNKIVGNYNLVEVNYKFGIGGISLFVRFTDFPETGKDLLKKLILKVKQREEKERASRENIVKYFFWGGTIYMRIENMSIKSENYIDGTTLILDHSVQGNLDEFDLATDGMVGTTTELISLNPGEYFADRFLNDQYFKNVGSTDAIYVSGTNGYLFPSTGTTYTSNFIEQNNNIYTKARYEIEADDNGKWTIAVNSNGTSSFENVGTTPTNITSGTTFRYKATYAGTGTNKELRVVKLFFT